MKKFITYSLFIFLLLGCEDTLEKELKTDLTDVQVFSNDESLQAAVNGMYYNYQEYDYHGATYTAYLGPASGKVHTTQGLNSDSKSLEFDSNNSWLRRMWAQMYETISAANNIINELDNSSVFLSNKDAALAQSYFLRGSVYFDLVRMFGGVPMPLAPSTKETLFLPRSSKQEVYDLVISDFEKAKELLPDIADPDEENNNIGYPTKYAANVFLAKVYMTLAGEDNGDPALWQNAYDELIPVYGKFSLVPTYAELFELGNENTSESIFELQYAAIGTKSAFDVVRQLTPVNSEFSNGNKTFGYLRPNKEVFDSHVNQYPDDPRIDVTYLYDSYVKLSNQKVQTIYPTRTKGGNGQAYPAVKKYFDETYNGINTRQNFIKLRYADVLLMLAEIQNELTSPSDAYKYVNEVLTRARNTSNGIAVEPADWSGMSQDEFRTRILRERQYELFSEGHDYFDSRRRGYQYLLDEIITPHNTQPNFDTLRNGDVIYSTDERIMLLPIPSSEINTNTEVSQEDQNPGY